MNSLWFLVIAQVRLITKLRNQSEFTQMVYMGEEKVGSVTVSGVDG
jgi:hypothetical protein